MPQLSVYAMMDCIGIKVHRHERHALILVVNDQEIPLMTAQNARTPTLLLLLVLGHENVIHNGTMRILIQMLFELNVTELEQLVMVHFPSNA